MFATSISIILSCAAIAAGYKACRRSVRRAKEEVRLHYRDRITFLHSQNESLKTLIRRRDKASVCDCPVRYNVEIDLCGYARVMRQAVVDGRTFPTLIKRFTDPDPDFNIREAKELCEILNS